MWQGYPPGDGDYGTGAVLAVLGSMGSGIGVAGTVLPGEGDSGTGSVLAVLGSMGSGIGVWQVGYPPIDVDSGTVAVLDVLGSMGSGIGVCGRYPPERGSLVRVLVLGSYL